MSCSLPCGPRLVQRSNRPLRYCILVCLPRSQTPICHLHLICNSINVTSLILKNSQQILLPALRPIDHSLLSKRTKNKPFLKNPSPFTTIRLNPLYLNLSLLHLEDSGTTWKSFLSSRVFFSFALHSAIDSLPSFAALKRMKNAPHPSVVMVLASRLLLAPFSTCCHATSAGIYYNLTSTAVLASRFLSVTSEPSLSLSSVTLVAEDG